MSNKEDFGSEYRVITPDHNFFDLDLAELYEYRDLIFFYARKNIVTGFKQTVLGPVWLFLQPLMSSLLYLFVFGNLAGFSTDGVPKILFYIFSNTLWTYFRTIADQNVNIFAANSGLFGKVHFPRLTISFANMISSLVPMLFQFILGSVLLGIYSINGSVSVRATAPLALVCIPWAAMAAMGIGLIFSSITIRYRDLRKVFSLLISVLMYGAPVVYPMSQLSNGLLKSLIYFNPLTPCFETMRHLIWGAPRPPVYSVIRSVAVTLITFIFGMLLFNHTDRTFVDVI